MSCSIVFIQWGGESERESVSCPDDTIAGSSTVRSGAPLLFHPGQDNNKQLPLRYNKCQYINSVYMKKAEKSI